MQYEETACSKDRTINKQGLGSQARLGFVQRDQKLIAAVRALGGCEEDCSAWPVMYCFLLAMRTLNLISTQS